MWRTMALGAELFAINNDTPLASDDAAGSVQGGQVPNDHCTGETTAIRMGR